MDAQQSKYVKVVGGDYGESSGDNVSTESNETLMGHGQKNWEGLQAPGSARQNLWRRFYLAICSLQGLLNTLLLLVILGLIVDRRWHRERHGHFEGNGDITGFAPSYKSNPSQAEIPDHSAAPL